ncbi:glutaredoxin family protein [Amphibiibacter pelophylacis]|uniref:Uncharacterized protein n=1 Tax=Amphibiibacter pelophylacis TaxID=1799477 RepID=A0ACC6P3C6_9BURK
MTRTASLPFWRLLRTAALSLAAVAGLSLPVLSHAAPAKAAAQQVQAADDDEGDADFLTEYVDEAQQLRRTVKAGDIFLYSSVNCGICSWARGWMEAHKIPFGECFIEEDVDCLKNFRTAQRALKIRGTPLTLVRGQFMQGYDPDGVIRLLRKKG